MDYLKGSYLVSERRACRTVHLSRTVYHYESCRDPRTELRVRMRDLAGSRVRYGYRKIHVLLQREGYAVSRKVVYRVYKEEGLSLRQKPRRKHRSQAVRPVRNPVVRPDQIWSLDFVSDQLANGQRFRALTVLDVYTREALAIEIGQHLKGTDVVRVLETLRQRRGCPECLYCDNGSEFTSQILDLWAYHYKVRIDFSRPGKPTDNAFIESFNGTFRSECLSAHWFNTLSDARMQIERWRIEYNESRPHRALGELPPAEFARRFKHLRDADG